MDVDVTFSSHAADDIASDAQVFASITGRNGRDLQQPGARVSDYTITRHHWHTVLQYCRQSTSSLYHHSTKYVERVPTY